jgi:enoyl-CoA hydratase/carnithine racemase
MQQNNVAYDVEDRHATVTLDDPDTLNSLTPGMEKQLHEFLDEAEADDAVRVIVLTGRGKGFSVGYNMGESKKGGAGTAGFVRRRWEKDTRTPSKLLHIMNLEKPVIGAINGFCMGAGLWYALACDLTYAAEGAIFAQPEVRHGSTTSVLFSAVVGWKHANRYALTGDHFDAHEALRIGMLNEVVPAEELLPRVYEVARRMANLPADVLLYNKAIQNEALMSMGVADAMRAGSYLAVIAHAPMDSEDFAHMREAKSRGDVREFVKRRDDPFLPEFFGPRSRARQK